MASIRVVVSCLLICQLMLDTANAQKHFEIKCQKSDIEAQFGTNTLLDCSIITTEKDVTIRLVSWKLNRKPVLTFYDGTFPTKLPSFQFAQSSWDQSNLNVSLLITNTNLSHIGDYSCQVVTDVGDGLEVVRLTLKAPYSKPIIDSDSENITPDKAFTLTCKAHGGFPLGRLRWVVDGGEWNKKPEDEVTNDSNGLYNLANKLYFPPNSRFIKFTCEVYNASGVLEGQSTREVLPLGHSKGSDPPVPAHSVSQIVAPVVVIGSLIVGLLVVLLVCRRRHQNVPMPRYPDDNHEVVLMNP